MTQYPVLRRIFIFQVAAVLVGIALVLGVLRVVTQGAVAAAAHAARVQIEPILAERQEQWRAWKALGQEAVLAEDIGRLSKSFPDWVIAVVPGTDAGHAGDSTLLLPQPAQPGSSPPDFVVSATLDVGRLASDYRFGGGSAYLLAALSLLFIGVVIVSSRLMRRFLDQVMTLNARSSQLEREAAIGEVARQVAHDIRSPLMALDMAMAGGAEAQQRVVARNAVARINDIANNLLGRSSSVAPPAGAGLLFSMVESLLSEKRTQYRDRTGLTLHANQVASSYGVFVSAPPLELKRVLSNLVNNSVEAIPAAGRIDVHVRAAANAAVIEVVDDGKGIPPEILPTLMRPGVSHGKEDSSEGAGSGLGLAHSKRMIESWGGTIAIESEVGRGTTVRITLPRAQAPSWFVEALSIPRDGRIVVCDDEPAIHQIWIRRLEAMRPETEGVEVIHHFRIGDMTDDPATLFLVDFEFPGERGDGLQRIVDLNLTTRAVLVTSRYEQEDIQARCRTLGVRMIPKDGIERVPLDVGARTSPDVETVLIDDDPLVRQAWRLVADTNGKRLTVFASAAEFLEAAPGLPKTMRVYIDSDLGTAERGEDVARRLSAMGFQDLHLTTGSPASSFAPMPWLKSIGPKNPPWEPT